MSDLTPEQLVLIESKRQAALRRLAARNVCAPIGDSWKREIDAEFSKPYFTKVLPVYPIEQINLVIPDEVSKWQENVYFCPNFSWHHLLHWRENVSPCTQSQSKSSLGPTCVPLKMCVPTSKSYLQYSLKHICTI